jgi:hypothetical protein
MGTLSTHVSWQRSAAPSGAAEPVPDVGRCRRTGEVMP